MGKIKSKLTIEEIIQHTNIKKNRNPELYKIIPFSSIQKNFFVFYEDGTKFHLNPEDKRFHIGIDNYKTRNNTIYCPFCYREHNIKIDRTMEILLIKYIHIFNVIEPCLQNAKELKFYFRDSEYLLKQLMKMIMKGNKSMINKENKERKKEERKRIEKDFEHLLFDLEQYIKY